MPILTRDNPLVEAVYRDPEDNTVRLVLADWLDEHDDPARAEFIRKQVELETLPEWGVEYHANKARCEELWNANQTEWLQEVPTRWRKNATFHRGFCDEIRLTLTDFLTHGDEILTQTPARAMNILSGVSSVGYGTQNPDTDGMPEGVEGAQVTSCPHWSSLKKLKFTVGEGSGQLLNERLICLAVRQATGLTSLEMQCPYESFGGETLRQILRSPCMKTLHEFKLGGLAFDEQLAPITRTNMPNLAHLRLEYMNLSAFDSPAPVRRFFSKPALKQVRRLDFSRCEVDDDAIPYLTKSPLINACESLVLDCNLFVTEGLKRLSSAPKLNRLKHLSLLNQEGLIAADDLRPLAWCKGLQSLEYLDINEAQVKPLLESMSKERGQDIFAMPSLQYINHRPLNELAAELGVDPIPLVPPPDPAVTAPHAAANRKKRNK